MIVYDVNTNGLVFPTSEYKRREAIGAGKVFFGREVTWEMCLLEPFYKTGYNGMQELDFRVVFNDKEGFNAYLVRAV